MLFLVVAHLPFGVINARRHFTRQRIGRWRANWWSLWIDAAKVVSRRLTPFPLAW
jgi:hypothetical protein